MSSAAVAGGATPRRRQPHVDISHQNRCDLGPFLRFLTELGSVATSHCESAVKAKLCLSEQGLKFRTSPFILFPSKSVLTNLSLTRAERVFFFITHNNAEVLNNANYTFLFITADGVIDSSCIANGDA